MLFKIKDLKHFLFSINKHKIKNIHVKSENLELTINTKKQKDKQFIHLKTKQYPVNKKDITENEKFYTIEKKQNKKAKKIGEQNTYFTIVSPMIGTFYRSPAPNEAPFIKINEGVKINQTVCIIEAMKLMNEIESEVNGNIEEILVQDGDIVDCGQALMRVKQNI